MNEKNEKWAEKWIEEYEAPFKKLITQKWAVGFNDRGMGRGDYGVVVDTPEPNFEEMTEEDIMNFKYTPPALVAETLPKIVAEHIVEVHNASIESASDNV